MTLLISFLAITNMAIGYGLAVYLGQGRLPVQIALGRFRKSKTVDSNVDPKNTVDSKNAYAAPQPEKSVWTEVPVPAAEAESLAEPEQTESLPPQVPQLDVSDLMPGAEPERVAPEAEVGVEAEEQVAELPEKTEAGPVKEEQVAEAVEPVEEVAEATPTEPAVETPVAEEVAEEVTETVTEENETIEEEVTAEVVEPPVQEVVEESVAEEPVPEEVVEEEVVETELEEAIEAEIEELNTLSQQLQTAVADSSDDANEDDDSDDDSENASVDSSDSVGAEAKALEGIEAFQAQLKEQQQVTSEKTAEETEADSKQAADQPVDAETLAGIQAFQDQLAKL